MTEYEFSLASSLQKVFPSRKPIPMSEGATLSLWRGTRGSVQLVYRRMDCQGEMPHQCFHVEVLGAPVACQMRKVRLIPSDYPCYGDYDAYYITTEPGLFPDLLEPVDSGEILPITRQYRSLWLTWEIPEDAKPGDYEITVKVTAVKRKKIDNGLIYEDKNAADLACELRFILRVGAAELPAQSLIHTEWFYTDCLANYYGTEMFDERHWEIIENFIKAAHRHGVNMLLTPALTPPLDTPKGSIRRIAQLVKIKKAKEQYSFDFSALERWTDLCRKYGIEYLEIAHFFTQWGSEFTPNILADVDGETKLIFGWDHPAAGEDYQEFMQAYIPQLRSVLEKQGYDAEHVYYHVSDEPSEAHLKAYQTARNVVRGLIPESQIMDALSSVEFYKKGIVPHPIAGSSEIEDFYQAQVPGLWVYYCCAQCKDVPNRFFAQESACTRMMGVLMYLYDIKGFLHWGFNFYNSKFSGHTIDPYVDSHADFGFPSGDPFLVYPGKNGEALDSLRAEVQDEGLLDLRALQMLEKLASREVVEEIIYRDIPKARITFKNYPRNPQWLLNLRERVAAEINRRVSL